MRINKKILRGLFLGAIALMAVACNSGNGNSGGTGSVNSVMTSFSGKDNEQLSQPLKDKAAVGINYTLDGEAQPNMNLNDMGWHLLTLTVTSFSGSPQAVEGVIARIDNPNNRGQVVNILDVNCANAIFGKAGDTCSSYIQISYNYQGSGVTPPCLTNITVAPGSWPNISSTGTITDTITPTTNYGDYRAIQSFETKYYTGSAIAANPNQYQMVLMQNGSISPINVTTISPSSNPSLTLVNRTTSANNDPVYGPWSECSLTANPALNQVSTLAGLNSSCILVYQAAPTAPVTTETSSLLVNTNATQSFPYNAISYQMQANYSGGGAVNGLNWEPSTLPQFPNNYGDWGANTYGNGKFVVISSGANISSTSTDGVNWIPGGTLPNIANIAWFGLSYGDDKFVTVGSMGTGTNSNNSAYSSDGVNWNQGTLPSSQDWHTIAYGNGKFVTLGGTFTGATSNVVAYSSDGINWNQGTLPSSQLWSSVTYGNNKFIALSNTNVMAYSLDGVNWNQGTMPSSQDWYSAAYGDGKFVAISDTNDSSNVAAYSTDGINWNQTTLPLSGCWTNVAYGDGVFVAAQGGGKFAYSTDGVNWNPTTSAFHDWYSMVYGNGKFVATSLYGYVTSGVISMSPNNLNNFIIYAN